MLSIFLKNLSILKKFLFINFLVFLIIGILTFFYLNSIKPSIIKDKTSNHIEILNNTIENINRLNVNFNEFDIKNFLFSTRFLFQNLDRVQIFDKEFKLIGDTDTLDLDPRAFSQKLEVIEMNDLNEDKIKNEKEKINISDKKNEFINLKYDRGDGFAKPGTSSKEDKKSARGRSSARRLGRIYKRLNKNYIAKELNAIEISQRIGPGFELADWIIKHRFDYYFGYQIYFPQKYF